MTDEITELREFTCQYCGHRVVVNPKLPKDYEPTICTPCWEQIVKRFDLLPLSHANAIRKGEGDH